MREYNAGKYDQALKEYEKLLENKKDDPRLHFNAGAAAYRWLASVEPVSAPQVTPAAAE